MRKVTGIGIMSGTSLDGMDIALCEFTEPAVASSKDWGYTILRAETYSYEEEWRQRLENAHLTDAASCWKLHVDFGHYTGQRINSFLAGSTTRVDFIASHGHTVFHQPHNGFTCQIGDGAAIAAATGIKTVCDFRSTDVAHGGQGAPLVPIGDQLLFGNYQSCLNIGGIANISFNENGQRIAFDVCPANMVFNFLAKQAQQAYDKNGEMARSGTIDPSLLHQLNELRYYQQADKKSIGREWVEEKFMQVLSRLNLSVATKMATVVEHCAQQIAAVINKNKLNNVLLSGGGAYHRFLVERIGAHSKAELIIPDNKTIEFKEALVFAFLGLLRLDEKINCLRTVTGADKNSIGGAVYL